jgi:hypothetical protein
VALGHHAAYVMAQMGHTGPQMTLGLYAKSVRPADRDRLRALAEGQELALLSDASPPPAMPRQPAQPQDRQTRTGEPPLADRATTS